MNKRYTAACILALLALLLMACAPAQDKADSTPAQSAAPSVSGSESSSQVGAADSLPEQAEPPAGAAVYRGQVTGIEEQDGAIVVALEQVWGVNYGAPSILAEITESTRSNLGSQGPNIGDYIEVHYGRPMGGSMPERVSAILAMRLPPASDCIINGVVEELTPIDDATGRGSITIAPLGEDVPERVIVRYDRQTRLYLNVDKISAGSRVSIYTDGQIIGSTPPEVQAVEVRVLYEEHLDQQGEISPAAPQSP